MFSRIADEIKRWVAVVILICFTVTSVLVTPARAQAVAGLDLPAPGVMLHVSEPAAPVLLRGLKVDFQNPFHFDFLLDLGHEVGGDALLRDESLRLVKYFLAALTIPEDDMWVNLSPYEKERIIPEGLGQTEVGRDLLAQDYVLKQFAASLFNPDTETGKQFWSTIYRKAEELFGTTDIPVDTFHKIWIVPGTAVVYQDKGQAYVGASRLKVMLERDYIASGYDRSGALAASQVSRDKSSSSTLKEMGALTTSLIRDSLLPVVEKEVNEGRNFAKLRQSYYSIVLAAWYKRKLKESLLGQIYVGKDKIQGIDIADKNVRQKIYTQYLEAFRKGVFNYIREEYSPLTSEPLPRKYFSGGEKFDGAALEAALEERPLASIPESRSDFASLAINLSDLKGQDLAAQTRAANSGKTVDNAASVVVKPEGAAVLQSELPDVYWHNGADIFRGLIETAKRHTESVKQGGMTVAERDEDIRNQAVNYLGMAAQSFLSVAKTSYQRNQLEEQLQKFQDRIKKGHDSLSYAFAMTAFWQNQAPGTGVVSFPRDAGFLLTEKQGQGAFDGTEYAPGLYYISGSNQSFDNHYHWMSSAVGEVSNREDVNDLDSFIEALNQKIDEEIEAEGGAEVSSLSKKLDQITSDLERLGILELDRIMFVDSGYKTFPLMFAALVRRKYPGKKVEVLVQESSVKVSVLPQLDINTWPEQVREAILKDDASKYAKAQLGQSESMTHAIEAKPTGEIAATDAVSQFEAFFTQMAFVLGVIRYNDLVNGLKDEIVKQNKGEPLSESELEELIQDIISEGLDIVQVEKQGVTLSGMATYFTDQPVDEQEGIIKVVEIAPDPETGMTQPLKIIYYDKIAQIEARVGAKLGIEDYHFSGQALAMVKDLVSQKQNGIDVPAIRKTGKSNSSGDDSNGGGPVAPQAAVALPKPTITFVNADHYIEAIATKLGREAYNQRLTATKWYNFPLRMWLAMSGKAQIIRQSQRVRNELRDRFNNGGLGAVHARLGASSAEDLTGSDSGNPLAEIAKRDMELAGASVIDVTDQQFNDKVKEVFLEFIQGKITDDVFQERIRKDVAPLLRSLYKVSAVGSEALEAARAWRAYYQGIGADIQQLTVQDLNRKFRFADVQDVLVNDRNVEGWWDQKIRKVMDTLQSSPLPSIPVLGVLTSPLFVGSLMSVAGYMAIPFVVGGAKIVTLAGLSGVLFPVLGTPALLVIGVAAFASGLIGAFRQSNQMWRNLQLLEQRESLGEQSTKRTKVEEKMLSRKAIVQKADVQTAIEDINRLMTIYLATNDADSRNSLLDKVAEILARVEYGRVAHTEYFLYNVNDRLIDQEGLKTYLYDVLQQGMQALNMNRGDIQKSDDYQLAVFSLQSQSSAALDAFRKIKRREAWKSGSFAAVLGGLTSFALGWLYTWFNEWLHPSSATTVPASPAAPATKTVEVQRQVSLPDLLSQNLGRVSVGELRTALVSAGVAGPDKVIKELFPTGNMDANALTAIMNRMKDGTDTKLSDALKSFLEKKFGVSLPFDGYSPPAFVREIWNAPGLREGLTKAGVRDVGEFQRVFEQKMGDPKQGAWSIYETLRQILGSNQKAKRVETLLLNALNDTDATRKNLQDLMRMNHFLEDKESVERFLGGPRDLFSRYRNYVLDQKGFRIFSDKINTLKGSGVTDFPAAGKQIMAWLESLNTADRVNVIVDWIHRYEEWAPKSTSGTATGSFRDLFFDRTRSPQDIVIKISQEIPAPAPAPAPVAAENPFHVGPVITAAPVASIGLLANRRPVSGEQKNPSAQYAGAVAAAVSPADALAQAAGPAKPPEGDVAVPEVVQESEALPSLEEDDDIPAEFQAGTDSLLSKLEEDAPISADNFSNGDSTIIKNYTKSMERVEGVTLSGGNVDGTRHVVFKDKTSGQQWMFKAYPDQRRYRSLLDYIAYRTALRLGLGSSAMPVFLGKINIGTEADPDIRFGTFVKWIDSVGSLQEKMGAAGGSGLARNLTADQTRTILREQVLDWLISQHDSHVNSFLIKENGDIVHIDLTQSFKYLGSPDEHLAVDYNPNAVHNGPSEQYVPVYNFLLSAISEGNAALSIQEAWAAVVPVIKAVQDLDDKEHQRILELYAKFRYALLENQEQALLSKEDFLKEAMKRKDNLAQDFQEFYAGLGLKDVKGGINFDTRNVDLGIKGDGDMIFAHFDQAQIEQFSNIQGFMPVIESLKRGENISVFFTLNR